MTDQVNVNVNPGSHEPTPVPNSPGDVSSEAPTPAGVVIPGATPGSVTPAGQTVAVPGHPVETHPAPVTETHEEHHG